MCQTFRLEIHNNFIAFHCYARSEILILPYIPTWVYVLIFYRMSVFRCKRTEWEVELDKMNKNHTARGAEILVFRSLEDVKFFLILFSFTNYVFYTITMSFTTLFADQVEVVKLTTDVQIVCTTVGQIHYLAILEWEK